MAITYQWNDPHNRVLKRIDDSTSPDTVTYIPAVKGLPEYNYFRAWDAQPGQDATPFRPSGYDTLANAKTTRIRILRQETMDFCRMKNYDYWLMRSAVDENWSFAHSGGGEQETVTDAVEAVFTTATTLETAINGSSDIDAIRNSTVDFVAGTHSI